MPEPRKPLPPPRAVTFHQDTPSVKIGAFHPLVPITGVTSVDIELKPHRMFPPEEHKMHSGRGSRSVSGSMTFGDTAGLFREVQDALRKMQIAIFRTEPVFRRMLRSAGIVEGRRDPATPEDLRALINRRCAGHIRRQGRIRR